MPLEGYHLFVNGYLPAKCVYLLEVFQEAVKEGLKLEKRIVTRLPLSHICRIVIQVNELHYEGKPITFENL